MRISLRQKKIFFVVVFFLLVGATCLCAKSVLAQTGATDTFGIEQFGQNTALGGGDIRVTIARIIRALLTFLGVLAVCLILYAGFTIMTAGGNEDKVGEGKKILINAVIGLVIIMSAWSIAQYVLTKLSEATGTGNIPMSGLCQNPVYANDPQHWDECRRGRADCSQNPAWCCSLSHFVVKSITPRTSATNMNNARVRAIFSQGVQGAASNTLQVLQGETDITSLFDWTYVPDSNQSVVEGVLAREAPGLPPMNCPGCLFGSAALLSAGTTTYTVQVKDRLNSLSGRQLETQTSCGMFSRSASFRVNTTNVIDTVRPRLINGITIQNQQQADIDLPRGASYPIGVQVADNSGASYVHLEVQPFSGGDPIATYDGPTVTRGSDASSSSPYKFVYPFFLSRNTPPLARYLIRATVYDIDSNVSFATSSFIVVGERCHNGVQDAGEIGVDIGGECLGAGQCLYDWQCSSHKCDPTLHQCVEWPMITSVDPWDGAADNWITIVGKYFGTTPGTVEFLVGGIWRPAKLADCDNGRVWTDNWVIVSVPEDSTLPQGASAAIRIVKAGLPTYIDTTIDDHGPIDPVSGGLFTKNTIKRPGLCNLQKPDGTIITASTPANPIVALGQGFGSTVLTTSAFTVGGVQSSIQRWSERTINTNVPENLQPGKVAVKVTVDGRSSNGLPLTILSRAEDQAPIIDALDPIVTTRGSYVTIFGKYFGATPGTVYITSNPNVRCPNTACTVVSTSLAPACGNTWGPTQVIFQIPSTAATTTYFVTLQTNSGLRTAGKDHLAIVNGDARPSICRITPNSGPAPRPSSNPEIRLDGIGFAPGSASVVYFWRRGAIVDDMRTWLSSALLSTGLHIQDFGSRIDTEIPVLSDGTSMQTGPIVVSSNGQLSNSLRYTVSDCRQAIAGLTSSTGSATSTFPGLQCCASGPDAGLWKPSEYVCAGEVRDAGYVWRFTTGRIPNIPAVVEECPATAPQALPSPTPWFHYGRRDGAQACLNSTIAVRFTTTRMDTSTYPGNVRVYTCSGDETPACQNKVLINPIDLRYQPGSLTIVPSGSWRPKTWYHVELGAGITSREPKIISGNAVVIRQPIRKDRPCGGDTAYCFDFKTGESQCSLVEAFIQPPVYTSNFLGVVQDNSFAIDTTHFDNPPWPLYYYVWGRGNQECSVINVDGMGWQWSSLNTNFATVASAPTVSSSHPRYTDSRGVATAVQDTAPLPNGNVTIQAITSTFSPIMASTQLFVHLGEPEVLSNWPACTAACINTTIGVTFSRQMITSTYASGFSVHPCNDELCNDVSPTTLVVNPVTVDPVTYRVSPAVDLLLGKSYWVEATSTILAMSGVPGSSGNPLKSIGWSFRTKSVDGTCIIDQVRLDPHPFTARIIGEKTVYTSIPHSAPDACSRYGQELNPWGYGWNWNTVNPPVATVSNFRTVAQPKPWCTFACVPKGSDEILTTDQKPYLCGNGQIDPGEGCDLGMVGERVGISCSLNCLRVGNPIIAMTGLEPGQCGNGLSATSTLDARAGESCDPGLPRSTWAALGCSPSCLRLGSPPDSTSGARQALTSGVRPIQSAFCGDGITSLNFGEDCDSTDLARNPDGTKLLVNGEPVPEVLGVTCTNDCRHIGIKLLAQSWCTGADMTSNTIRRACLDAVSTCGNGKLELGEQCEFSGSDVTQLVILGATDIVTVTRASDICSPRCTLKTLCPLTLTQVPINASTIRCRAGDEGCTPACIVAGSSLTYSTPTLCGDAVTSIGEYDACEYHPGEYSASSTIGQNPIQLVTAVGNGVVNSSTLAQSTRIQATAERVRRTATETQTLTGAARLTGSADYALQCGNTEYFPEQARLVPASGTWLLNDCQNNIGSANQSVDQSRYNLDGVAYNSCCYARPRRALALEYPLDGAGFSGSVSPDAVCRNTYIEVTFDQAIDENTLPGNIFIADGHTQADYACGAIGETNVTDTVLSTMISYLTTSGEVSPHDWFGRTWALVKHFFASLFGEDSLATTYGPRTPLRTWCTGKVTLTPRLRYETSQNGQRTSTTISLYLGGTLQTSTAYAVVMRGGPTGIKDLRGVSILPANPRRQSVFDSWLFQTGEKICKIKEVAVTPNAYIFTTPNTSTVFLARAMGIAGQSIVPIRGVYDWTWNWGPTNNSVFAIPMAGSSTNTPSVTIAAKNVEGRVSAFAQVHIVADVVDTGLPQIDQSFSGAMDLTALFCERPWPPRNFYPYQDAAQNQDATVGTGNTFRFTGDSNPPTQTAPGVNSYFNFSFGYCPDAGKGGVTTDDLPFLRPLIFGNGAGGVAAVGSAAPVPTPVALGNVQNILGANAVALSRDTLHNRDLAYVTAGTENTLYLIDVTNPYATRLVRKIPDNSQIGLAMQNPIKVAVASGANNRLYAYVIATQSRTLSIIDVTDTDGPVFVTSTLLNFSALPAGSIASPTSLTIDNGKAYIGLDIAKGALRNGGLAIFDVSQTSISRPNLVSPRFVTETFSTSLATFITFPSVEQILVANEVVYVLSKNGNMLVAYTIRAPLSVDNPQFLYYQNNSGSGYTQVLTRPKAFALAGNQLITVSADQGVVAKLDIANRVAAPRIVGQTALDTITPAVTDMALANGFAFVTTQVDGAVANSTNAVYMLDTRQNRPGLIGVASNDPNNSMFLNGPIGVAANGTVVYVASARSNALQILDAARLQGVPSTAPARAIPDANVQSLKKVLFFNDRNDDVIGIQIFANPDRLPARDWYGEHFPDTRQTLQPVQFNGYTGVTDGVNYYINALNQEDNYTIKNYIYLFSINDDANTETKTVFEKLLKSLRFTINISDFGYCSTRSYPPSGLTDFDQPDAILSRSCSTDFDCFGVGTSTPPLDRVCANARTKFTRDWDRLHDVQLAQKSLENYRTDKGTYPVLASGSFIPHYSNSRWAVSWESLKNALSAPPLTGDIGVDPVNQWTTCGANEPQTCWNAASSTFVCPAKSSMYEYTVNADGDNYTLHAPLEYFRFSGLLTATQEFVSGAHFVEGQFCIPEQTYTSSGSTCGDGVVNSATESCDPPGVATQVDCTIPGQGGSASTPGRSQPVCDASCRTIPGQCLPIGRCGNGVVDPGEVCDDGDALNGTYGHCAASVAGVVGCTALHTASCGNTIRDFVTPNPQFPEFRASGATDPEFCEISRFANKGFCQKQSCRSGVEKYIISSDTAFTSSQSIQATAMSFVATNTGWMVGSAGKILKTTNSGVNWNDISSSLANLSTEVRATNFTGVYFLDSLTGWVIGNTNHFTGVAGVNNGLGQNIAVAVILKTTDGGRSWVQQTAPASPGTGLNQPGRPSSLGSVHFWDNRRGMIMNSISAFYTNDGGDTWVWSWSDQVATYKGVQFVAPNTAWFVGNNGSARGYVGKWVNDGTANGTWTSRSYPFSLSAVYFLNSLVGWAAGGNGNIIKTIDGGTTWTSSLATGVTASLSAIYFIDAGRGWAVGGGDIISTVDGGTTWKLEQKTPGASLTAMGFVTSSLGYITGGNSVLRKVALTQDPYCLVQTMCSSNDRSNTTAYTCQNNDVCAGLNNPSYNAVAESSCAVDCQGYGGYCGDGIIQGNTDPISRLAYEECDDGANNGTSRSACSMFCMRKGPAPLVTPVVSTPQTCGDNIVETQLGEVCDLGRDILGNSNNGRQCDPVYDRTCTYCAADCRSVLTREAIHYCGDGVIDPVVNNPRPRTDPNSSSDYEACDTLASGSVMTNTGMAQCSDRGAFQCANHCRSLVNGCITCGIKRASTGGATPKLALVNPMISPSNMRAATTLTWATSMYVGLYVPAKVLLPPAQQPPCPPGQPTCLIQTIVQHVPWYNYRPLTILPVPASQPIADYDHEQYLFVTSTTNPPVLQPVGSDGIETSALCRNEYWVHFSTEREPVPPRLAHDPFTWPFISASYAGLPFDLPRNVTGDFFPYTVNNDSGEVIHELVVSPALPDPRIVRVVVRWTKAEADQHAQFSGMLYNIGFAGLEKTIGYTRAMSETRANPTQRMLCDQMARIPSNNYWWPTNCFANGFENSVYVHDFTNAGFTSNAQVQAMTITLGAGALQTGAKTPYAFFIDPFEKSMSSFQRSHLQVEVYTFHVGQNPASVYAPTTIFSIADIPISNVSTNPMAKYWHAFNLVYDTTRSTYVIQQICSTQNDPRGIRIRPCAPTEHGDGVVVTGFQDVLSNLQLFNPSP